MKELPRFISALVMIILSTVLIGAFFYEYGYKQEPCPLCFLQRLMMIGIGVGMMLNLRHGSHIRHYDIAYFCALVGGATSIRQILLHICPDEKPFGTPILGLSLYSWAFIVFVATVVGVSVMLLLYEHPESERKMLKLNWFYKLAILYFMCVSFASILSAFSVCGFTTCAN